MLFSNFLVVQNSMMCPDAGKNSEDIGMVHLQNAEEPAAEGLTSASVLILSLSFYSYISLSVVLSCYLVRWCMIL